MDAASALTAGFLKGADLVAKWRSGKANGREIARLCVRYWGCVLFECDSNLEAIAGAVDVWREMKADLDKRPPGSEFDITWPAPILSFAAYDALVGDLARLSALPVMLGQAGRLIADMRTIADLIRLDRQTGAQPVPSDRSTYRPLDLERTWREACLVRAANFWIPDFNSLRDLVSDLGRKSYGDKDWQSEEAAVVPVPRPTTR